MSDSKKSQVKHSGNTADLLSHFREQRHEENRVEVSAVYGACFVYHPEGCDQCSIYLEHLREDIERRPFMYVFTKDEILSGLNDTWPHIREYIQQLDEARATFKRELYDETAINHRLRNENKDLRAQIITLETRLESLQPPSLSERILVPTPTTESPTGSHPLTTPLTQEEEPEGACLPVFLYAVRIPRLLPGVPTGVLVGREERTSRARPEIGGKKIAWEYLAEMMESQCEWLSGLPDTSFNVYDNEGYFLEQDVDVAAWLTKVIGELPRQAVMLHMKDVFGSRTNFDTACIGFDLNLFCAELHRSRWLTETSLPLRIGSQITKGIKGRTQIETVKILEGPEFLKLVLEHCSLSREQIYHQIILYMIWDDEKWPLSSAAIERAAYMALREQEKAPYKGKKPATANRQSKPSVHAPTPAKTGESSRQQLDADLESYGQAREQVLPYDEAPPSGEPDAGEIAPPPGGANITLYDESTMDIDHIVEDIYRDC
ncbi:hypothetical protein M422DRAFT_265608 [Sphaerobolus stellatus SS14]|uniref:Uncharacterized protein n=1 Tax=Sphaerobolus stellatus (strain SS14) TaxID=990650 RepID=A0A0C9V509_SPHS4|nr:hypothetical protein M422DRAFT_265608 [Sphaerobolus stellatus SS14]